MSLRAAANGRVFADVVGDGAATVVFLHGWGRSRADLVRVGEGLDAQCVYVDLPGFGASPSPDVAGGAREYATVVGEAIGELTGGRDGRKLILVGHSFGGRVALCIAARDPGVAGLVLTGTPLLRRSTAKPRLAFRVARALHRRGLLSDAAMERRRQRYGSADYRAAQGIMRDVLVRTVAESYEAELGAVRCPVKLVWGADDTAAPPDQLREADRLLAAPHDVVVLDGVGHDVHRARPEVLRDAIAALCAGVP